MASVLENQVHKLRARFQGSQAARFLQWWWGELRQMLPATWQARMQHARRRLIVRMTETDLAVAVYESGRLHEIDRFPLEQDSDLQRQQLRDLLNERELLEAPRDLLLPEARVLRKEVVMPAAAESNLRQALSFEMDRQTPFGADEVCFDYRILSRDKDSGQLRLELLVTLSEPLDRDIARLAPRGMAPTGADVEVEGLPAGVNLLPLDRRFRMVNRRARFQLGLGAAVVALLVLVMAQSIWLRRHQIDEVAEAMEQVRGEAMRVQEVRDQIQDATEAANFMREQRASKMQTVKVLAEVTRILPDDTFLDRLMIGQGNVQMQGKSANAQRLIELVNESAMFRDASFRGPTRLDTRSNKEIFDLTATLVGQES
jgi:general secretion pathway protein L